MELARGKRHSHSREKRGAKSEESEVVLETEHLCIGWVYIALFVLNIPNSLNVCSENKYFWNQKINLFIYSISDGDPHPHFGGFSSKYIYYSSGGYPHAQIQHSSTINIQEIYALGNWLGGDIGSHKVVMDDNRFEKELGRWLILGDFFPVAQCVRR